MGCQNGVLSQRGGFFATIEGVVFTGANAHTMLKEWTSSDGRVRDVSLPTVGSQAFDTVGKASHSS